jgi:F5/8 type C domain
MSEFKYACPVCGQHMKCDSSQSGTVMECPTCFQKITAPQAPATDDPKFIITGTKVGERPVPAVSANSGVAIAPPKDSPVAGIAFVILLCAVVAGVFVFRGVIFKPAPTATNTVTNAPGAPSNPAPVISTATVPAGDIVLGKPALASSQENGNPVENGNDGNIATRWCASTGDAPQWWEVDLGSAATITNTQIIWEHNALYQYLIEVSSNRTNWTVAVDKSAQSIPASTSSDDFSANGRYVRVVITGLQEGSWASFYEFQAFGSINGKK